jgi:mRNA interferase RelE/StbE
MKILVDKSFERDVKRLPIQVQKELKEITQKLLVASLLSETNSSKMEGAKNAYRIRFGSYRIGFYLEEDSIILSRVLDRREIYWYFPKK